MGRSKYQQEIEAARAWLLIGLDRNGFCTDTLVDLAYSARVQLQAQEESLDRCLTRGRKAAARVKQLRAELQVYKKEREQMIKALGQVTITVSRDSSGGQ